eukprot:SAG22_NODE_21078_length_260_cov_0.645963_1_plen_50_part_01
MLKGRCEISLPALPDDHYAPKAVADVQERAAVSAQRWLRSSRTVRACVPR